MSWSFDEHYGSREKLCRDVSVALNKEMKFLVENGAKIIQIDELAFPGFGTDIGLAEESIAELTRGVNAYVILRVSSQGLAEAWTRMQKWPVDQFYIDMVNTDFDVLPLLQKTKTPKDLAFGIISSHEHAAEPIALLTRRIKKILPVHALERIWFGTDAGTENVFHRRGHHQTQTPLRRRARRSPSAPLKLYDHTPQRQQILWRANALRERLHSNQRRRPVPRPLVGPNGAGKSTPVQADHGIRDERDSGEVAMRSGVRFGYLPQ